MSYKETEQMPPWTDKIPLIFGKYDPREVVIKDIALKRYINLEPRVVLHTCGRHANKPFAKIKMNIVERLINHMMRTEHATGKKMWAYKTVRKAFEIIEKRTKQNPIQVLADAIEKAGPREEVTRLKYGGISVPKAVDTSSLRRINIALMNMCKGAIQSSRGGKKRIEVYLAEEIIKASKGDVSSFAISKKEEMERVAASAR